MAVEWYRMYHGAPTDPCWLVVGRMAGVVPGMAWSVWTAVLDRASQAGDRGCVEGFDCEAIAAFFGYETEQVQSVLDALAERGMLVDGRVAAWDKRQPKRPNDNSLERVRKHRAAKRSVTHGNATKREETTDKIRVDKKETDTADVSEADMLFELAWKAYPRRPNNSKADARRAWNARINDGVDPRDLLAGTDRYAKWVEAEQAAGRMRERRFIKQAATFFGPAEWWKQDWEVESAETSHMTADYLATILNMAGNGVWSGETRDAALYRTSQNYDADEWAMIVPYLDHFPWTEARAAKADKFMLRDVLKRHIARTDRERAHAA